MADEATTTTILRTKLYRPPAPGDYVHRQRLLDQLDQWRRRPLTLVSAPAGYGKSILISSWLQTCEIPTAWLSLDEDDNELRRFLFYFIAAVQSSLPVSAAKTLSLLDAPELPPVADLARPLINELDELEQDFILALDDFQFIRNNSVIEMIREVLRHPLRHMHLVVISRKDPFLPIAALRARNLLTELRTHDLRFTASEVKAFVKSNLGDQVADAIASVLAKKSEGWVTGLRLAVLAMRGQVDGGHKLSGLEGTTPYVMDYLMSEVLANLPPAVRHLLLNTSILDRLCAPLCDTLRGSDSPMNGDQIDGRSFIALARQENLFLIALDAENHWFRYHHLFRNLLQSQLRRRHGSEEIATLHARASEWFAANGLIDKAIRHALKADDVNGAVQLVEQNRQAMLNSDRGYIFEKYEKWLAMLPDTVIQQRPQLLMAQIWVRYFQNRLALIPPLIDAVEALLNDGPEEQILHGEIYLFKGVFSFLQGDGSRAMKYIEDALDRIPEAHHVVRGFAESYLGLTGQMQGQQERVVRVLYDIVNSRPLHFSRKFRVTTALAWIHLISGDLSLAAPLSKQLEEAAVHNNVASFRSWALYNQGLIHFHRNELDAAIQYFSQAAELGFLMVKRAVVDCLAGLSLAYQAAQKPDKAIAALDGLFQYVHALNDPVMLDIACSCRTRLSLMQGEAPATPGASHLNPTSNVGAMVIWLEIPCVTHCRALIAEGSDLNLREAEDRLRAYAEMNEAHHNTCQLIGILSLLAVACAKQGKLDEARLHLEQALTLARPGGFIFPFLEIGLPMADLLHRLYRKKDADGYIGKLLAALGAFLPAAKPHAAAPDVIPPQSPVSQPLVEPLTHRELDVLELLAQRLRNKEIAEELFISPETVRTHLRNIYQKLNVGNRRQAIAKAADLGILVTR